MNAGKAVFVAQCSLFEGAEEVGYALVESEFFAQLSQRFVAHAVDAESIEQFFEVYQFAIPTLIFAALVTLFPEEFGVDAELGEDGIFLHVVRAERFVEVKDESDGVLRYGHGRGGG